MRALVTGSNGRWIYVRHTHQSGKVRGTGAESIVTVVLYVPPLQGWDGTRHGGRVELYGRVCITHPYKGGTGVLEGDWCWGSSPRLRGGGRVA